MISDEDLSLNGRDNRLICHVRYYCCRNVEQPNGIEEVRVQEHAVEHSSNKRLLDYAMMRGCKYSAGNLFVQHSLANL